MLHPTEAEFDFELVLQQLLDMLHLVYAGVVHDEHRILLEAGMLLCHLLFEILEEFGEGLRSIAALE